MKPHLELAIVIGKGYSKFLSMWIKSYNNHKHKDAVVSYGKLLINTINNFLKITNKETPLYNHIREMKNDIYFKIINPNMRLK